jgi:hypothetical protein
MYCIFSAVIEIVRIPSESETENEWASASGSLAEADRLNSRQRERHTLKMPTEWPILANMPYYQTNAVGQSQPTKGCICFWSDIEAGGLLPTPTGLNPMGTSSPGGEGC